MKKIVTLALVAAAFCGTASVSAQEVTFVEDCSQGLLYNRNADNWFLTVEGGANVLLSPDDKQAEFKNRIGAQAGLYLGKWVSPVFGFRFGGSWIMPKGATTVNGMYRKENAGAIKGNYYPEKFMGVGPEFDVLINLTNWWCGYKPNRVYNAVLHGGAGAYWTMARRYKGNDIAWRAARNTFLFANVGLQNNFRLSNVVDLFIDLKAEIMDLTPKAAGLLSASLGLTFNLGKSDFNCPVTAVCPVWNYTDAEGDALVARLASADAKIKDLQRQLDECLKRPTTTNNVVKWDELATIYYPINVYSLSAREKKVLDAVAAVMKEHPNTQYEIIGWADTFTGTEEYNAQLREKRAQGVADYLVKCGVPESQFTCEASGNTNLKNFTIEASAPLDRAVTIKEK